MSAFSFLAEYSQPQLNRRIDLKAVRIAVLLGAVCVLNGLDLIYTLFADRIRMLHEMNPLAEAFIRTGLTPSLICFKILMVVCGLGLLWRVRHSRLVLPACWLLFITYIALCVMWYMWVCDVNMDMEVRIANGLPMTGDGF